MPRRVLLLAAAASMALAASSQSVNQDEALLNKARSLYDTPLTGNLASFSCAVQFDWKRHFEDLVGTLPSSVVESVERLQKVQHSVKVNASGAKIFSAPHTPDFGGSQSIAQLEQVFTAMLKQGLNAWLPFSTNVILPASPTAFHFEDAGTTYKLTMAAEGVEANLLLNRDLRIISGVTQLPQPTRFTTHFVDGPHGYLLESVTSGPPAGSPDSDTTFDFTYQTLGDFQIPSSMSVSQSSTKPWHFALTHCNVVTSAKSKVRPPQ
jgi:hypothetical protein